MTSQALMSLFQNFKDILLKVLSRLSEGELNDINFSVDAKNRVGRMWRRMDAIPFKFQKRMMAMK
jgi:hypothetical protein